MDERAPRVECVQRLDRIDALLTGGDDASRGLIARVRALEKAVQGNGRPEDGLAVQVRDMRLVLNRTWAGVRVLLGLIGSGVLLLLVEAVKRLFGLAGGLVLVLLAAGCSLPANPRTEFAYGPARFVDTKDNDVQIRNLRVDPVTGVYAVDEVTIRNNASDVRRANVEQIEAYTEQVRAVTALAQEALAAVRAVAPYAAPAVAATVPTPLGTASVSRVPATQPAGAGQ